MTDDEQGELNEAFTEAGVRGADDLGRFVSNTGFFRASEFDEKNAMPVLLDAPPTLSEPPWSSLSPVTSGVHGLVRKPS